MSWRGQTSLGEDQGSAQMGEESDPSRPRARALAFYLPQFHPTEDNDRFWGPGFTEWTNVARGRPLFRGHEQPRIPGRLGFYDLRVPEVREAQARLARAHGIEAFCYYHYWFAGRRVLDRPFREVLDSGEPDFPFALAWANESWTGVWHGSPNRTLIEQTYPGDDDHRAHFAALEPAFHDPRHLRVDGRPLFYVYRPFLIPELSRTLALWRELAERSGLPGLHIVGQADLRYPQGPDHSMLDGVNPVRLRLQVPGRVRRRLNRIRKRPWVVDYGRAWPEVVRDEVRSRHVHPCVIPNWDNTPRSGLRGRVYVNATPEVYAGQLERALGFISHKPFEERLLFIKSWNEWAEGNYLEPDWDLGDAWLRATRDVLLPATAGPPAAPVNEPVSEVEHGPRP